MQRTFSLKPTLLGATAAVTDLLQYGQCTSHSLSTIHLQLTYSSSKDIGDCYQRLSVELLDAPAFNHQVVNGRQLVYIYIMNIIDYFSIWKLNHT